MTEAAQLSYLVLSKERRGRIDEELKMTDSVKKKACGSIGGRGADMPQVQAFVQQYMERVGPVYVRPTKPPK